MKEKLNVISKHKKVDEAIDNDMKDDLEKFFADEYNSWIVSMEKDFKKHFWFEVDVDCENINETKTLVKQ